MSALLIGTYTEPLPHVEGSASGILTADFVGARVEPPAPAATARNPSYLAISEDARFVYAVEEAVDGAVTAYDRDPCTGALTKISRRSSGGSYPCHLAISPGGGWIVVTNYGGTITVFPIASDGSLEPISGSAGIDRGDPDATGVSRPHMAAFDPETGHLLVADLGLDAILDYSVSDCGQLTENVESRLSLPPGSGPRHLAFHPNGSVFFTSNELDSSVAVVRRTATGFALRNTTSSIPAEFTGRNDVSAIRVSASGRYVLVANRGMDSIAVLEFDEGSCTLSLVNNVSLGAREPREFAFTPDGGCVIAASQNDHQLVTFAFDETTGGLQLLARTPTPSPVCLLFVMISEGSQCM